MKRLSEHFNSISVKKGECFAVDLLTNGASTGYMWDLDVTAGDATVIRKEYVDPNPPKTPDEEMVCGKTIIDRTIFRAEETGTIELQASYRRPWEKGSKPAQQKTFKITVE
jgi:predicted secreted protein